MKISILFPFILLFSLTLFLAQWQPDGATLGNIHDNGGNVGVDTNNPGRELGVNGIAQLKYFFANAPNIAYTGLQIKDDNGLQWAVIKQSNAIAMGTDRVKRIFCPLISPLSLLQVTQHFPLLLPLRVPSARPCALLFVLLNSVP